MGAAWASLGRGRRAYEEGSALSAWGYAVGVASSQCSMRVAGEARNDVQACQVGAAVLYMSRA